MSDDNVLTPEEQAELTENQALRKALIKDLVPDGKVPARGQVFLLGLLDGVERQAFTKAKLRQQSKRDADTGNFAKAAAELLKSINPRTYRPPAPAEKREIPEEYATRTFVPGELEMGSVEPITIEQVMRG